jgi:hypothetical protein
MMEEIVKMGLPYFAAAVVIGVGFAIKNYRLIRQEQKAAGRRFSKSKRR